MNEASDRQLKRYYKVRGIDQHDYGFELCEICNRALSRDNICENCGLPSKKAFLNALNQLTTKEVRT